MLTQVILVESAEPGRYTFPVQQSIWSHSTVQMVHHYLIFVVASDITESSRTSQGQDKILRLKIYRVLLWTGTNNMAHTIIQKLAILRGR